jgi:hypothetical protein
MRATAPLSDTERHSLHLDGHEWRIQSIYTDRREPPLRDERAALIAQRLPEWAVAAGHTAGWVWTGLGKPEPWAVLCATSPALSPIARTQWKPRAKTLEAYELVAIRGLTLLGRLECAADLLSHLGEDDVAAAQLYSLITEEELNAVVARVRESMNQASRDRARRRVAQVRQWWRDHPVVTR